jgi:hypothetical protein
VYDRLTTSSQIVSDEEEFEIKKILKKDLYNVKKNSRRST